jgi:anthranilate synthase component 1
MVGQGNVVPVYREVMADLETPVSAYLKIARGPYSFLLESVEGGEHLGRYSFIGTEPYLVLSIPSGREAPDPLPAIQAELERYRPVRVPGLPRFCGGAVGYLAYEVARCFERIPAPEADPLFLPRALFMFTDTLLVFDHLRHTIKAVSHVRLGGDVEAAYRSAAGRIGRLLARLARRPKVDGERGAVAPTVASNLSLQGFRDMVLRAKDYIEAGDIIQVVLSQRLARPTVAHPFGIYRCLRTINPSPYMYYLHLDDFHLVGASPEMLLRVEDGLVSTHPIAGTRPRGHDHREDAELERELRADEKERAEHLMLVDLGRNDIGRVSAPGSVQVTQFMDVERYSHVMHLVSHVQGRLRQGLTAFDALRACFPAGTVSGAPKIRAMEIIAELEPEQRGPYAGAVGYFDYSGNLDTAITIRTVVVKEGVAYLQAGAGIVADSVPEREYEETLSKVGVLLRAIEEAEGGAPLN